ncbi:hypothetical protein FraQA3DRAFT_2129 [Frankia sp. QA3]|nr:hypothetical protein FraQA3DRAFT_2129 [Frankia sp. QA3]
MDVRVLAVRDDGAQLVAVSDDAYAAMIVLPDGQTRIVGRLSALARTGWTPPPAGVVPIHVPDDADHQLAAAETRFTPGLVSGRRPPVFPLAGRKQQ